MELFLDLKHTQICLSGTNQTNHNGSAPGTSARKHDPNRCWNRRARGSNPVHTTCSDAFGGCRAAARQGAVGGGDHGATDAEVDDHDLRATSAGRAGGLIDA